MLTFNSDNPSLNPAEAYSFFYKNLYSKRKKINKEAGVGHFFKK